MKCPYCGAEIEDGSLECAYCGSRITAEMKAEQDQLNRQGCPKCGSTNITYTRENHGEIREKDSKRIIRKTVAVCNDCGNTWEISSPEPKKRKTWLWVLGWIFIFPVPLTILMLRKKDMKPVLKYGIIAAAWIVYLMIGLGGNSSDKKPADTSGTVAVVEEKEETAEKTAVETGKADNKEEAVAEVTSEPAGETARTYEESDKSAVIDLATGVLKEQIPDVDVPSGDAWTVAKFDNEGAVMAMAAFEYEGKPAEYIYVSTLEFDGAGGIVSNTDHYIEAAGNVILNDHYCDKVFETLRQLAGSSEGDNSGNDMEDWTNEQKNAYKSAKQYLQFMAFSRQGLVDQLSSEYGDGYPEDVAEFAVSQLEERGEVDWDEQAEKSAREYLNYSSFSKSELIDQLSSEYGGKFTREQAERDVETVYDE